MLRIFLTIQLGCAAFLFMTCERSNMYDLALYGIPPNTAIYIYPTVIQPASFGNRNDADMMCYQQGMAYHTLVNANTVKAFVSFSVIDELRFLVPIQYWHFPVIGISSTLAMTPVSDSWLQLLSGIAGIDIMNSVGLSGNRFWSGSNVDGSVVIAENCSGWDDTASTSSGRYGGVFIYDGTTTCDDSNYVLCIAY